MIFAFLQKCEIARDTVHEEDTNTVHLGTVHLEDVHLEDAHIGDIHHNKDPNDVAGVAHADGVNVVDEEDIQNGILTVEHENDQILLDGVVGCDWKVHFVVADTEWIPMTFLFCCCVKTDSFL